MNTDTTHARRGGHIPGAGAYHDGAIHECETCVYFDSQTSRCPHLPIVPVVGGCEHWRRHTPYMVARVEGEGGACTVYDLSVKSYPDELALIALAAMRDLTGWDYQRIIRACLREVDAVSREMPF